MFTSNRSAGAVRGAQVINHHHSNELNAMLYEYILYLQGIELSLIHICGGYQLMGLEIHDPEGVEGEIRQLPGLGLLPVITTMQGETIL